MIESAPPACAPVLGLGDSIRPEFPVFGTRSPRLAYLDSAASTFKPRAVVERLSHYLLLEHANIHRGAYALSARATELYDEARESVACFIGAKRPEEVIFTRGTTESINLVAHAIEKSLQKDDVILLTLLEHHSNIVPWQLLAERRGARVVFVPIANDATVDVATFESLVERARPRVVAFTAHSNAFGTKLPVSAMVAAARKVGAFVLVDAAQAISHGSVSVTNWGADFIAFSGHKMYGPTGIGVLYASENLWDVMQPFQGGGDMIETVTVTGSTWAEPPRRFEAGTPAIAEAVALGVAIDFIDTIGRERIQAHEGKIFSEMYSAMKREPGVTLYGPGPESGKQAVILPFSVEGVHPHDFATIADEVGVQVRAGHHCAQPALRHLSLHATTRASVGVYSDAGDVLALIEAVRRARRLLA